MDIDGMGLSMSDLGDVWMMYDLAILPQL